MRRVLIVLGTLVATAVPAASAARQSTNITVFAASSLTNVFPAIAPGNTYSFGGSNSLAAQIQGGSSPADVFASANMSLPNGLYQDGDCSKPVVFTRNTLVIVVPTANPAHIKNIYDLTKKGVTIDVAQPSVPVGGYTQQILNNMNIAAAVNANVVSQETSVTEVLAHVTSGDVDAGFVYATDAKSVPGQVKVIKIPAWAQPKVRYGICVVSTKANPNANQSAGRAFIKRVLSAKGQRKLHKYGFLPRVKPKPRHHRHKKT